MPNLPSEKGQINITGVNNKAIELFRWVCAKEGRKQHKQFEIMLNAYVDTMAQQSPMTGGKITSVAEPKEHEEDQTQSLRKSHKRQTG
jgi:hypothetical protein